MKHIKHKTHIINIKQIALQTKICSLSHQIFANYSFQPQANLTSALYFKNEYVKSYTLNLRLSKNLRVVFISVLGQERFAFTISLGQRLQFLLVSVYNFSWLAFTISLGWRLQFFLIGVYNFLWLAFTNSLGWRLQFLLLGPVNLPTIPALQSALLKIYFTVY